MSGDAPAQKLEGRSAFADGAEQIARGALRELRLLTFDFDRRVYGTDDFVALVKAMVLASDHARVRVLINQPRLAMQGAHRLIELGRQVPSRIEFRELLDERQLTHRGEWLINDRHGLLERREPDALYARLELDAPVPARQRTTEFDGLWDESPTARELRVLAL